MATFKCSKITQHTPSRAVLGTSASSEAAKPESTQAVISFCQYEGDRNQRQGTNLVAQNYQHQCAGTPAHWGHSLNCSPASRCSKSNGTNQRMLT